ncbi:histidine kinase dimerization/phospho-acceptor domain-containing protein [Nocardioides sp.]|uniref:histidine kinase dimerization/phospho-acceptor domain-containing protein n=1 Tax=Nocardioides sp. TaxID=35761 RepID=UPI002ED43B88
MTTPDPAADFARRVSHDLKNPLSSIRMSLELAREELGEDADQVVLDLIGRAERNAVRLEEMLDALREQVETDQ